MDQENSGFPRVHFGAAGLIKQAGPRHCRIGASRHCFYPYLAVKKQCAARDGADRNRYEAAEEGLISRSESMSLKSRIADVCFETVLDRMANLPGRDARREGKIGRSIMRLSSGASVAVGWR